MLWVKQRVYLGMTAFTSIHSNSLFSLIDIIWTSIKYLWFSVTSYVISTHSASCPIAWYLFTRTSRGEWMSSQPSRFSLCISTWHIHQGGESEELCSGNAQVHSIKARDCEAENRCDREAFKPHYLPLPVNPLFGVKVDCFWTSQPGTWT